MSAPYASPRHVESIDDCFFYHTMEIPGHGKVDGIWDIRNVAPYVGHLDYRGKRVLEVGTASGYIGFSIERSGAEVVAFDLDKNEQWDIVPYAGCEHDAVLEARKNHIDMINNAWWFNHAAFGSSAQVAYGNVYAIPETIGEVDVSIFGMILVHVRDPFLALQNAARLTREKIVITERVIWQYIPHYVINAFGSPTMRLEPQMGKMERADTWWILTPRVLKRFLGILGFTRSRVRYHRQRCLGRTRLLFTIVAERTIQGE